MTELSCIENWKLLGIRRHMQQAGELSPDNKNFRATKA